MKVLGPLQWTAMWPLGAFVLAEKVVDDALKSVVDRRPVPDFQRYGVSGFKRALSVLSLVQLVALRHHWKSRILVGEDG